MNLLLKLQQILEIHRLERRYTRRSHRSTTWTDSAIYVDGEYVYPSSTPTHSSSTVASPTSPFSSLGSPRSTEARFDFSGGGRKGGGGCKRVGLGEGKKGVTTRRREEGRKAGVGVWVREVVGR